MIYLNTHTHFSLRYGTLSPIQLVTEAAARGVQVLPLTDINNTSCSAEFTRLCLSQGIRPVLGIEFRTKSRLIYIGLSRNANGFESLNRLLSGHLVRGAILPERLSALPDIFAIYPELPCPLEELLPHEFVGFGLPDLPTRIQRLNTSQLSKVVILHTINHSGRHSWHTHRLLRCIDEGIVLSRLQRDQLASPSSTWLEEDTIEMLKINYAPLIANTGKLLDRCEAALPKGGHPNLASFSESSRSDIEMLHQLCRAGLKNRYSAMKQGEASQRLDHELAIIADLRMAPYYLVTWDMLRYARSQGFPFVGRGSGANSLAAYCLGITNVEPLELGLHFERFLNPQRAAPPDFDIDFSWQHRDKVLAYLFERHGLEHTALLASYNTFKGKSIVRELGKVFGLTKGEIDQIVQHPVKDNLHPDAQLIFRYGRHLQGMPNYLSIHSGGVIISSHSIDGYTARQMMPKGLPISQCDMHHAEMMGFHKFDVLSQRGLGHIEEAVQLVEHRRGHKLKIHDMHALKRDKPTLNLLAQGECIGCFYIESPAMRGLLQKMRCRSYLDLVAATSIIRPGVAKSGMMRSFLRRRQGTESTRYLHPDLQEALSGTYGVMVYQEDVMKVVTVLAGFDASHADLLRRLMTGKEKSLEVLQQLRTRFQEGCQTKGMPADTIEELWRQIASFSGYSFCKAHSASYAAESMQSLYLKAHHPLEFITAVINNEGGFYSTEVYVHEARRMGIAVEPPCLQHGRYDTSVQVNKLILGWKHVKGFRRNAYASLENTRRTGGLFGDLTDLVERLSLSRAQMLIAVRVGGARFTGCSKRDVLLRWLSHKPGGDRQLCMPWSGRINTWMPPHGKEILEQQPLDELELLGFTLSDPFHLLEGPVYGIRARELSSMAGKSVQITGYFVIRKPVTTENNRHMCFATWIDQDGEYFDSVHFPLELERFPFTGSGFYLLSGKVELDDGYPLLEIKQMRQLASKLDGLEEWPLALFDRKW